MRGLAPAVDAYVRVETEFKRSIPGAVKQLLRLVARRGLDAAANSAELQTCRALVNRLDGACRALGRPHANAPDVLTDEGVRTALLQLLGVSVRIAAEPLSTLGRHVFSRRTPPVSVRTDILLRAVRMDTLQRCARRMAALTEEVAGGAEGGAAPAAQMAAGPFGQTYQWFRTATDLLELLCSFLEAVWACADAVQERAANKAAVASLLQELGTALRDSAVLDHAGRLVLRLLERRPGTAIQVSLTASVISISGGAQSIASCNAANATCKAAIVEALRAPCARYAALVAGLGLLCAADGGPAYGLPTHVLEPLVSDHVSLADRDAHGRMQLPVSSAEFLVVFANVISHSGAVGPRAALALQLRIGGLATASGRVHAGVAAAAAGAVAPRLVLSPDMVADVAMKALLNACRLMAQHGSHADWAAVAEADVGRLAADAADSPAFAVKAVQTKAFVRLADALGIDRLLPAGLTSAVANCLAVILERSLRCGGREDTSQATLVLCEYLEAGHGWARLRPLLVSADVCRAAAVVRTMGKLVRLEARAPGTLHETTAVVLQLALGARAALANTGCHPRLARLASYALHQWLPALCAAALLMLQRLQQEPPLSGADVTMLAAHFWLVLHLWTSVTRTYLGGRAAATSEAGSSTPGGNDAADAGGWRQLLLRECAALELTTTALQCRQQLMRGGVATTQQGLLGQIADCMCCAAEAWPQEVLPALAQAAPPRPGQPSLPAQLRALSAELVAGGVTLRTAALGALAAQVEMVSGGGQPDTAALRTLLTAARHAHQAHGGQHLLPPAEVRRQLQGCSYPACTRLDGDSEAALRLQACAKCGEATYCSRACQVAHWREAHKAECGAGDE